MPYTLYDFFKTVSCWYIIRCSLYFDKGISLCHVGKLLPKFYSTAIILGLIVTVTKSFQRFPYGNWTCINSNVRLFENQYTVITYSESKGFCFANHTVTWMHCASNTAQPSAFIACIQLGIPNINCWLC